MANSADLSYCQGLPHASECNVQCAEGYTRDEGAHLAVCQDGLWHVRGECLRAGADVVQRVAAQVLLQISLDLPEESSRDSLTWAQANLGSC